MADRLSRPTALALIQEAEKRHAVQLPEPNLFARIPADIPSEVSPAEKTNFFGPEPQREEGIAELKRAHDANLEFYRQLVGQGWIKEDRSCGRPDYFAWEACFSSNHPDVKYSGSPGRRTSTDSIMLPMAKRAPGIVVTGIRQEGSGAIGELEVTWVGTEIYNRTAGLPAAFNAKYSNMLSYVFRSWQVWPQADQVSRKVQCACQFNRYDDGWRVMGCN